MNKALLVAGVIIVLLVGGFVFWTMQNPATPPTGGTTVNITPGQDTTGTEAPTPSAPTVVTSINAFPSDTTVVVSGTITPNGASTNYWFEYGTTASFGSKTATQNVGSGFIGIPAPLYITGLAKDTTYSYRLVATNALGTTMGATYTFKTTVGTAAPVGSVPTVRTIAASNESKSGATMNGEVTPNKSATQYWFEYGTTDSLGSVSALQSIGDGTAKVPASLALTGLQPATTYYYRINAQNQFGTVNGAVLHFKTSGSPVAVIPVVTTQVAGAVTDNSANLRGTVNPYNTQTMYWFEYSTDSNFASGSTKSTSQKSAGAGATTVSVDANVSSLASKTTYYYRTVAQNPAGTVRGTTQSFKTN